MKRSLLNRIFGQLGWRSQFEKDHKEFHSLTNKHPSDKWATHNYTEKYFRHFQPLRHERLGFLEIGVGGYENDAVGYANSQLGGDSLRFWKDWFPKSVIHAIDIQDKSALQEDRIVIMRGSQTDESFLKDVVKRIGKLDVVIDDGSHINSHVIQTFKFLFPLLSDGGVYVVEDTQTSYWPGDGYGGDSINLNSQGTMMGWFKSLIDGLNHAEYDLRGYSPTYFDRNIVSMHFYHNLVFIYKGQNNCPSNNPRY
jgi:hypothetical protein